MKRTFIYKDDKSDKFWTIEAEGSEFTVTYGKTGTAGQTSTKAFDSEEKCQKEVEKLIAEKTKKGYVEQGSANHVAEYVQDEPFTLLAPKVTQLRELVSIPLSARPMRLVSMDATSVCALTECKRDNTFDLFFIGIEGLRKTVNIKLEKSLSMPELAGDNIYIYIDGFIHCYSKQGELLSKQKANDEIGHSNYSINKQGELYYIIGKSVKHLVDGVGKEVAVMNEEISFAPFMLPASNMVIVLRSTPRTLVHLTADGKEQWRTTLEGPNAYGVQPCSVNRVICQSRTHINLVDLQQKKCVSIPLSKEVSGKACPVDNEHVAYVSNENTVEFVSWKGKHTASFLRQEIGKTNVLPIATDDVSLFVPSLDNRVFRLAANGTCTGVCTLANDISEKRHICTTADGMVAVSDSKNCINLIPDSAFVAGETPKAPAFLTERAAQLVKHFAPWAATNACKGIIKDVLARLVAERSEGDTLELDFLSPEGETITVSFGEPSTEAIPEGFPESQRTAAVLHSWVEYDNGDANGFYWSADGTNSFDGYDEYDFEADKKGLFSSNEERYAELAYAGQNWYMIDKGRTNKLGEPLIITFDHGGDFSDPQIFGDDNQKKTAYGIPGFIFRVIGYYILPNDPRFDGCGMG